MSVKPPLKQPVRLEPFLAHGARGLKLGNIAPCKGSIDVFECSETNSRLFPVGVKATQHLHVRGWSFASKPQAPFDRYFFAVDNLVFPAHYGLIRNDVVQAHGGAKIGRCGFDSTFPVAMLKPGEHTFTPVGRIADRYQSFGATTPFYVLSAPELITDVAPETSLPGRVRSVRELQVQERHDGRAERAIRRQTSLLVEGWIAASTSGAPADEVAVVLSGHGRLYHIAAQSQFEPEAGTVLGPEATACGYRAGVASNDLLPGIYDIGIEVSVRGDAWFVRTNERVEIMSRHTSWLPRGLPTYRTRFEGGLHTALPERMPRNDMMLVSGWVNRPASVSGVYARIDGEFTCELTSGIITGRASSDGNDQPGSEFGGILAGRLGEGMHEIEILALDANHSAVWSIERHAFVVVPDTLVQVQGASHG